MPIALNTQQPYQLVVAGSPPGIISNRDVINQALFASSQGDCFQPNPNSRLLDPLAWFTYSGHADVWGIAVSGQPVVDIFPETTNLYTVPKAYDTRLDQTPDSFQIEPNTAFTVYNGLITGDSYSISLGSFLPSGLSATAAPFVKLSLIWSNTFNGTALDIQHWFTLMTDVAPGNCQISGRGPCLYPYVKVLMNNKDTIDPVTSTAQFFQDFRKTSRHDIRSVTNNIATTMTYAGFTFSTPVSDMAANILGTTNSFVTLPNTGSDSIQTRILGLYSGQFSFFCEQQPATAQPVHVTMFYLEPEFANVVQPLWVGDMTATVTNLFVPNITAPRVPIVISFQNIGSATTSFLYQATLQEFSS
ncbi:MAG TPA: hypothetical protein VGR89_10660 [Puia sp.]|nr:hypothetical protein [Puia sp.]